MENKRIYTLYMHTNKVNDKKYIGITMLEPVQKRWKRGSGYKTSTHFHRAIQKYGWDNFKHEIILCNLTKEQAEMFEIEMIKYHKSSNRKHGYNIDMGGNHQGKTSEETRKKQSKQRKGKVISEEHKKKLSVAFSGKNNPMYGTKAPTRKKVMCLETMKIYDSINHAATENALDNSAITSVCRRSKYNKSCGGLHWVYYEDWLNNPDKESYIRKHSQYIKVVCIETEKVYNNIESAKRDYNIKGNGISLCCRKIAKTCNGLHWAYYDNWVKDSNKESHITHKPNANSKKVICIDDGTIYESVKIAGEVKGVCKSNIASCCRGKYKQAGGYHWKYVD